MSEFLRVVHAVKSSNEALKVWQKLETAERLKSLLPLTNLLREARTEILKTYSDETGAPADFSLDFETSLLEIEQLAKLAATLGESDKAAYLPIGLIGLITGSKNLFTAGLTRACASLLMGNAVIWKPSPKIEKTSQKLVELTFAKLEIPTGLINLLSASQEVSEAIIDHPAIHQIMFVGSTPVGKTVFARAAQAGKKIQLSMGARNAAIVFADTNFSENLKVMVQSFFDFHGLGRWRASRIFVQESVYKTFLEQLKTYLSEQKLSFLGSVKLDSKTNFEKAYLQAIDEKGKPLLEAEKSTPRAIVDLTNCSTLQQDEIEGPLITISSFKYQFDAIKFANTSPLGKAAYVWSSDIEKAKKVARRLEVGRVFINEVGNRPLGERYAGAKDSGFGGEGLLDLLEFNSHKVDVT